ncbi:MAG: lytic transglycosylase domain-containing protein [Candidatus Falkowbacteria bacterium]|nr:lytic transglycosylase domain-containing protein [Candidatus Falkowbacteria bacterium]
MVILTLLVIFMVVVPNLVMAKASALLVPKSIVLKRVPTLLSVKSKKTHHKASRFKLKTDPKIMAWARDVPEITRDVEESFGQTIRLVSLQNGVSPRLTRAVVVVESGGNEKLCSRSRGKSSACGLMQLKTMVARELGERESGLLNPHHNIHVGTRYLRDLEEQGFKNEAERLLAFNKGPNRARKMLRHGYNPMKSAYVKKVLYAMVIDKDG